MIDFGFDKLALIGAVALIVIGPERLPRVARTVGTLVGKAQRYVADVKAEVNRSIELEELQRMKQSFQTAAHEAGRSVSTEMGRISGDLNHAYTSGDAPPAPTGDIGMSRYDSHWNPTPAPAPYNPNYKPPHKNWRLKRSALPQWYRREQGVRGKVQSGAARVARHRPAKPQ